VIPQKWLVWLSGLNCFLENGNLHHSLFLIDICLPLICFATAVFSPASVNPSVLTSINSLCSAGPTIRHAAVSTLHVEFCLPGIRAQDAGLEASFLVGDVDRRRARRRAVLYPRAQLRKEVGWRSAHATPAVSQARSVVVPVKIINVRMDGRYLIVIPRSVLRGDDIVGLLS
jgi:hypothetical protein